MASWGIARSYYEEYCLRYNALEREVFLVDHRSDQRRFEQGSSLAANCNCPEFQRVSSLHSQATLKLTGVN